MKVTIEISEQEIKDLKIIRNYFGINDRTGLEHLAYSELDKLINQIENKLCDCGNPQINKNLAGIFVCFNCGGIPKK